MILLTVAYLHGGSSIAVRAIFSDPDKFLTADEFQFLFAVVIVFVFGPGAFSLDALIGTYFKRSVGKENRMTSLLEGGPRFSRFNFFSG